MSVSSVQPNTEPLTFSSAILVDPSAVRDSAGAQNLNRAASLHDLIIIFDQEIQTRRRSKALPDPGFKPAEVVVADGASRELRLQGEIAEAIGDSDKLRMISERSGLGSAAKAVLNQLAKIDPAHKKWAVERVNRGIEKGFNIVVIASAVAGLYRMMQPEQCTHEDWAELY